MEEALETAEKIVADAIRRGDYELAAKIVFRELFKPIIETLERISEKVERNTESINKLTKKLDRMAAEFDQRLKQFSVEFDERLKKLADKLDKMATNFDQRMKLSSDEFNEQLKRLDERLERISEKVERNTENIGKLTEKFDQLLGETGRLKGRDVEFRTGLMLQEWFRRHAPEYTVYIWDGSGADVIIEGEGFLMAVEIAVKPKREDVMQLKNGIGAIKEDWGRRPDVLVIYSRSGIVPKDVAELADRMGVKLAKKPRDLFEIMRSLRKKLG